MNNDTKEAIADIRNWQHQHQAEDDARFISIAEKLDSILEIVSAFKLGSRGIMYVAGVIIAIGTVISLSMRIFFGR